MRIDDLRRIRTALDDADLVLIGASNGLDMAEGLNVFASDDHFRMTYGDLADTMGASCILEGMHLSQGDLAQAWAWQARFARAEWLDYAPGRVMRPLRALVGNKDHFVLTCNMDARFSRAGFDEDLVLETEGTVSKLVCAAGCSDELYPAEEPVRAIDASTRDGLADLSLVPTCPHCGIPLVCAIDELRLRRRDAALVRQFESFQRLVAAHHGHNIVVLELGVGLRNRIIKQLLAQAVSGEPNLTYAIFNYNQVVLPLGMESRCIGVEGDMASAFRTLEAMR